MNDKQSKALEAGLNRVAFERNLARQKSLVIRFAKRYVLAYHYKDRKDVFRIAEALRDATQSLIELEDVAAKFEDL